jgi:thermostable 8-oxoguanine DNA glycosylase
LPDIIDVASLYNASKDKQQKENAAKFCHDFKVFADNMTKKGWFSLTSLCFISSI